MSRIPAIVSVHDVMPATLAKVEGILSGLLGSLPNRHIVLLVVPGLDWSAQQISKLKRLQAQGYEVAGHGWLHHAERVHSPYHRLHSKFISRQAAEHLSLSEGEIINLMSRNFNWFIEHDFKPPQLYVPPAWAMGRIRKQALKHLPFHCVETTRGITNIETGLIRLLPLVGFEADSAIRAISLRFWNRVNLSFAKAFAAVRISIHPNDEQLMIANQLQWIVPQIETVSWQAFMGQPAEVAQNSTKVTTVSANKDEFKIY